MLKKLTTILISIFICLSFASCETEKVDSNFIVLAVQDNLIVEVEDNDVYVAPAGDIINKDIHFVGVLDIGVNKLAVSSCGNWGYPFIGIMNGKKSRAIANTENIIMHHEQGSDDDPDNMTSTVYFNCEENENYEDNDKTVIAGRNKIATWGPGWAGKRLGYCQNDHPPHCNQTI